MQKTLSDTGRIIRIGLFSWNILSWIPLPSVAAIPVVTPFSEWLDAGVWLDHSQIPRRNIHLSAS
ncbi:hypothetical protein OAA19_02645 [Rubripirellula sp.]|jgi:hypothetical protein|nr:hypothetical protein [Rubripirellula sp.]MDB4338988.1 hypothetical protein [Rubripirellula sp.]